MSKLSADDRLILRDVEVLLWAGWDPFGVGVPRDEYNTYALQVFGILKNGGSVADVANHLVHIEKSWMDLHPSPAIDREIIAEKAMELVIGREGLSRGEPRSHPISKSSS